VNCPPEQARELAAKLEAAGTPVTLEMFPGVAHSIPIELYDPARDAFFAKTLLAPDGGKAER